MKIFAIRDRMLDYFQVPVVVHRVQDLIAAISRGINGTGEEVNELAQAPDHYELWEIGEVDDQGHITPRRDFVANCAQFIRGGVWKRQPGTEQVAAEAPRHPGPDQGARGRPANSNGAQAVQNSLAPEGGPTGAGAPGSPGGSRQPD